MNPSLSSVRCHGLLPFLDIQHDVQMLSNKGFEVMAYSNLNIDRYTDIRPCLHEKVTSIQQNGVL